MTAQAEHSRLARELAAAGAVLLKTEGAALPVDLSKVRSILVVGSNGGPAVTIHGGGSGAVGPSRHLPSAVCYAPIPNRFC